MWKDQVRKRYRWASIDSCLDELIYELTKAEEEEEVGLYLLKLHYENQLDLEFFTRREREKALRLLNYLIRDTKRHAELLGHVVRELAEKRKAHAG